MQENQDIDITSLFKKIQDKLFISSITKKIEYLHYKESVYIPEIVNRAYEEAFFHFPYVLIKEILVGEDSVEIKHSIPVKEADNTDQGKSYLLCTRSLIPIIEQYLFALRF